MAIAVLAYSALMIVIGWVAVGQTGFKQEFLVPIVVATGGLGILYFGHRRRNIWAFSAGTAAVLLFCPSPLGLWPMIIGVAIALAFVWAVNNAAEGGKMTW